MRRHLDSKIKTFAIQCLVICLSFCYLVNPLHQGILNGIHHFSHMIVPHHNPLITSFENQEEEFHVYHDHDHIKTHSHKTINLLATLVKTFKDFENKILLSTNSIDKHVPTNIITIQNILPTFYKNEDDKPVKNVIAGFLEIIELPPRAS